MLTNPEKLLKDAGRSKEILLGWICTLIGITFAYLFFLFLYLVAWRNPQLYGTNDLFTTKALAILGAFLLISVGFFVLAFRLCSRPNRRSLISPLFLRVWGVFFGVMGAIVLLDAIVKGHFAHVAHTCEMLATCLSMMCAAFLLARRLGASYGHIR